MNEVDVNATNMEKGGGVCVLVCICLTIRMGSVPRFHFVSDSITISGHALSEKLRTYVLAIAKCCFGFERNNEK